jgi:hypothetical protein
LYVSCSTALAAEQCIDEIRLVAKRSGHLKCSSQTQ